MTKSQAMIIARNLYGRGVSLAETQGKGKLKRCQIWFNGQGVAGKFEFTPRRLIAHGDSWEEVLGDQE